MMTVAPARGTRSAMFRQLRRLGRTPNPTTIVLAMLCFVAPPVSFGKQATPRVEIRINELDNAPMDDPSDDYVTWAPTFCRAAGRPARCGDQRRPHQRRARGHPRWG